MPPHQQRDSSPCSVTKKPEKWPTNPRDRSPLCRTPPPPTMNEIEAAFTESAVAVAAVERESRAQTPRRKGHNLRPEATSATDASTQGVPLPPSGYVPFMGYMDEQGIIHADKSQDSSKGAEGDEKSISGSSTPNKMSKDERNEKPISVEDVLQASLQFDRSHPERRFSSSLDHFYSSSTRQLYPSLEDVGNPPDGVQPMRTQSQDSQRQDSVRTTCDDVLASATSNYVAAAAAAACLVPEPPGQEEFAIPAEAYRANDNNHDDEDDVKIGPASAERNSPPPTYAVASVDHSMSYASAEATVLGTSETPEEALLAKLAAEDEELLALKRSAYAGGGGGFDDRAALQHPSYAADQQATVVAITEHDVHPSDISAVRAELIGEEYNSVPAYSSTPAAASAAASAAYASPHGVASFNATAASSYESGVAVASHVASATSETHAVMAVEEPGYAVVDSEARVLGSGDGWNASLPGEATVMNEDSYVPYEERKLPAVATRQDQFTEVHSAPAIAVAQGGAAVAQSEATFDVLYSEPGAAYAQNGSGVAVAQSEAGFAVAQGEPGVAVAQSEADYAVAHNEPEVAFAQSNAAYAVAQSEPGVAFAQSNAAYAVAQGEPSVAVAQSDAAYAVAHSEPEVAVAQSDAGYAVAQSEPGVAFAQSDAAYAVAHSEPGVAFAQSDAAYAVAQGESSVAVTQGDAAYAVAQSEPGVAFAQSDGAYAVAHSEPGVSVAQSDAAYAVAQGESGVAVTQGDAAYAVAQGELGAAVAQSDAAYAVAQGELGAAVAQSDAAYAVAQGELGAAVAQSEPGVAVAHSEAAYAVAEDQAEVLGISDAQYYSHDTFGTSDGVAYGDEQAEVVEIAEEYHPAEISGNEAQAELVGVEAGAAAVAVLDGNSAEGPAGGIQAATVVGYEDADGVVSSPGVSRASSCGLPTPERITPTTARAFSAPSAVGTRIDPVGTPLTQATAELDTVVEEDWMRTPSFRGDPSEQPVFVMQPPVDGDAQTPAVAVTSLDAYASAPAPFYDDTDCRSPLVNSQPAVAVESISAYSSAPAPEFDETDCRFVNRQPVEPTISLSENESSQIPEPEMPAPRSFHSTGAASDAGSVGSTASMSTSTTRGGFQKISISLARGMEMLFGDSKPTNGKRGQDSNTVSLAKSVLPRELLPWSVIHSEATNMWVATVNTNQKALDSKNVIEASKSLRAFSVLTEQQATCLAKAWSPPRMHAFNKNPACHICKAKFAVFRRACHCRNCGVAVCSSSSCSRPWPAKMCPETYNIKKESFLNVCAACDFLCTSFRLALLEGDRDKAIALHATGNINVVTPFANVKGELFYPVHCAALGGNLELLKWLVDENCCPIKSVRVSGRCRDSSNSFTEIATSKGRSLLGIALENRNVGIVRYLVVDKGIQLSGEKDITMDTLCRNLDLVLRLLPEEVATGNSASGADVPIPSIHHEVLTDEQAPCHDDNLRGLDAASDGSVSDACIICFDHSIDCVATPCGHQVCCLECSTNITRCPVCAVGCSFMRVFRP